MRVCGAPRLVIKLGSFHMRGALRHVLMVDPMQRAKNMLATVKIKGVQKALEKAIEQEDYVEAARLRDLLAANTPFSDLLEANTPSDDSDYSLSSLAVLKERMAEVGVVRAAGCYCGADEIFEEHCGILHTDAAAVAAANPLQMLFARFSAFCEATATAADFIMSTTHPNNSEYSADRDAWRSQILDFCRSCGFGELKILQTCHFRLMEQGLDILDESEASQEAQEGDRTYITWSVRLRVLDGIVSSDYVETKDFVERSIYVRESGRWWYLGGDPDFKPKNIRVSGPLDQSGGGNLGSRLSGWASGLIRGRQQ